MGRGRMRIAGAILLAIALVPWIASASSTGLVSPTWYVDVGQRPPHYDCKTTQVVTTKASAGVQSAYGVGTCRYHQRGTAVETGPVVYASWNGTGTPVCARLAQCTLDLSVNLTLTSSVTGAAQVRSETWHFTSKQPKFALGFVVTMFDGSGARLGDGTGSIGMATYAQWREYRPEQPGF